MDAVNYADQEGLDVLSGPFSGCYMVRYKMAGANWRVAHVHTPGAIDAWNVHAQGAGFEISGGFKPFSKAEYAKFGDPVTYGLVTDTGACCRILAAKRQWDAKTGANSIYSRILDVAVVPTLPPGDLRVLTPMAAAG